jgi:hypothetical protein
MVFIGDGANMTEASVEPDLLTPILTQRAARRHFESGLTPITVYPEIISGNPYDSPCVARYVLNFPGLLGGDNSFPTDDVCFGYSRVLAEAAGAPDNIMFIPASDTRVFYPPQEPIARSGSCFYATKYKREHNGQLFDITKDSVEITAQLPTSQSPQEIAELFRRSEVFYTYENTALALEATLCGCPAVFLPNDHLHSIIASNELGDDGYAWGSDAKEIARAKATVKNAGANYDKSFENFKQSLTRFIALTQEKSKKRKYEQKHYLSICKHIAPGSDGKWLKTEIGLREKNYAPLLRKLPWRLEKEIGAFLCRMGLTSDGEFLWNRANRRSHPKKENKYDELDTWKN